MKRIIWFFGCAFPLVQANDNNRIEKEVFTSHSVVLSEECGKIEIDLPRWMSVNGTTIVAQYPLEKTLPEIAMKLHCYPIDHEKVTQDIAVLNKKKNQWELNPKKWNWTRNKLQQSIAKENNRVTELNAQNSRGWMAIKHSVYSQLDARELAFCLLKQDAKRAICGEMIVEYFPNDPQASSFNYEPIMLRSLQSIHIIRQAKS